MYKHCFICPTYGHYDYARASLESFFEHTPDSVAIVVDDGNPEFFKFWDDNWNVISHQFREREGLTRSWNYGLIRAKTLGAEYTICGNDDILFTPNWDMGPIVLLEDNSVGLVGPLSNAPGVSNRRQNVWDHIPNYKVSDDPHDLARVAQQLSDQHKVDASLPVYAVNGFFMVGKTAKWWAGSFDTVHVFNPAKQFSLVGNEDELQKRFRAKRYRNLVSLRTFIFHYRSVTRGTEVAHGMWHRRKDQIHQTNTFAEDANKPERTNEKPTI